MDGKEFESLDCGTLRLRQTEALHPVCMQCECPLWLYSQKLSKRCILKDCTACVFIYHIPNSCLGREDRMWRICLHRNGKLMRNWSCYQHLKGDKVFVHSICQLDLVGMSNSCKKVEPVIHVLSVYSFIYCGISHWWVTITIWLFIEGQHIIPHFRTMKRVLKQTFFHRNGIKTSINVASSSWDKVLQ